MVGAVVALTHLHRSCRRARGRASGGRGRCRRSACLESITLLITGTAYSPVAAGSPGPFDRNTPSGFSASMSSADVVAGTTVTLHAVVGEQAQDVALDAVVDGDDVEQSVAVLAAVAGAGMPLTSRPSRSSVRRSRIGDEVQSASRRPAPLPRASAHRGRRRRRERCTTTPFGMPLLADAGGERARVDTGDADDAVHSQPLAESGCAARQFAGSLISARSTTPRTPERAAALTVSTSSSLAPTLPMCGKVKVMI